jgi:hypothetical protein
MERKIKVVKIGDEIQIYECRINTMKKATATSCPYFQDDVYMLDIVFENGDEWYAVWDEKNERWESGEI